jgi:copper(I)-binding protein
VNRALRAATMGVLVLSPLALSACSAGQVTQTATQERDKTGAQAQVGDITLREARLAYPRSGAYDAGDDAELILAIVNNGQKSDSLTGVEGDGFGGAEISGDEIEVPADSAVFVGQDDMTVTLTDLDEGLTSGQILQVTLTFQDAGDITLPVSVGNPDRALERGETFDFHGGEENSGQVARENESADSK